jgi:transposase
LKIEKPPNLVDTISAVVRGDLTDAQWAVLQPLLPVEEEAGTASEMDESQWAKPASWRSASWPQDARVSATRFRWARRVPPGWSMVSASRSRKNRSTRILRDARGSESFIDSV